MLSAGIDLGTSGCRLIIIDQAAHIVYEKRVIYPHKTIQTPELWWDSVSDLLLSIPNKLLEKLVAICIDGTSGTLLLTDKAGKPSTPALMYNDTRAIEQANRIRDIAPESSGAHGAGSSLSKLLYLLDEYPDKAHKHALHQADWIANRLLGQFGLSDENNCLKLGYDSINMKWPDWLANLHIPLALLPNVYSAGDNFGTISEQISKKFNLPSTLKIIAGTTDSIAAFIATGASNVGEAVSSLGSTLAIKLISDKAIFSPNLGVYSHRIKGKWLVGGASNSGCAVLLKYFTSDEIQLMTKEIDGNQLLNLNYYPLCQTGERFPIANTNKQAILSPRPEDNKDFFQAILEGIADIEVDAYRTLVQLGAPAPNKIITVGGGINNPAWTKIRERKLDITLSNAIYTEAAYGVALLGLQTHSD